MDINTNTIIAGYNNTPLLQRGRSAKQKKKKSFEQRDLRGIYRVYSTETKYTFFSIAHGAFYKVEKSTKPAEIQKNQNNTTFIVRPYVSMLENVLHANVYVVLLDRVFCMFVKSSGLLCNVFYFLHNFFCLFLSLLSE